PANILFSQQLSPSEKAQLRQELILLQLREQYANAKRYRSNLEKKIEVTKDKLENVGNQINDLQKQLAFLEMGRQETEQKINNTTEQIALTEQAIFQGYEAIEQKEIEIKEQANLLTDYFAFLYFHKNKFYEPDYQEFNALKVLLSDKTVAETLANQKYLELLETTGLEIFSRLHDLRLNLQKEQSQLEIKRAKLAYLQIRLQMERDNFALQKETQQKFLETSKGREEIFQKMLLASIEEESRSDQEMEALQTNIDYFSKNLGTAKTILTSEDYIPLLRRPFSFFKINPPKFSIFYQVAGKGTKLLSLKRKSENLDILGPLGNGWAIPESAKKIALVAGGMGVAALVELAKNLLKAKKEVYFFLGLSNKKIYTFLKKELNFLHEDKLLIALESGASDFNGTVLDLLRKFLKNYKVDFIAGCGPYPMLKALKELIQVQKIPTLVSLDTLIACGLGACKGCAVETKNKSYKLACQDGPIFNLDELVL
ncbi:MAG: hypothetical protein HYU63_05315, partial [Armatimonadetes bacterium]|nr:hypothetical protein [Armatimonadota bacterium]